MQSTVAVQPTTVSQVQQAPLAPAAGGNDHAAFSAVLSGLCQTGHSPDVAPRVGAKASDPATSTSGEAASNAVLTGLFRTGLTPGVAAKASDPATGASGKAGKLAATTPDLPIETANEPSATAGTTKAQASIVPEAPIAGMAAPSDPAGTALTPTGSELASLANLAGPAVPLLPAKASAGGTQPHTKSEKGLHRVAGLAGQLLDTQTAPGILAPPPEPLPLAQLPAGMFSPLAPAPTPPPLGQDAEAVARAAARSVAGIHNAAPPVGRDATPTRTTPAGSTEAVAANGVQAAIAAGGSTAAPEAAKLISGIDVSQGPALGALAGAPSGAPASQPAPVSGSSPDASSQAASPAAPTDQIAPVMVGMLKSADGTQSVTVNLRPDDLGQVQIRIDRTPDGAAHVNVTAERPETLQLLQRDQPKLLQALDQAGVPTESRTVSFQAAAPDQVGASASRPDSMAAGSGDSGRGQGGGAWRGNDNSQSGSGTGQDSNQAQNRARWFRAGLDITA
jgi:hypothetical protein